MTPVVENEPMNEVGYSVSPMAMIYAKLIHEGFKSMEDVPQDLQVEVTYALKGME